MKVCGVKFKDTGKVYYFKYEDMDLKKNLTVVVETEKGEQFAKVTDIDIKESKNINIENMKAVLRISTKKDYNNYLNNLKESKLALDYAKELAKKMNIKMKILDASYTLDRKQLIFNFISDDRVDFRDLVKELAAKYKTRIELHQIGVRDKSKEIGGLGHCGRPLCCASFLNGIDTISINMAKNQNIALNPSKINGACGRLLCCLKYEDDCYKNLKKTLPEIGKTINTEQGSGKVVSVDILNQCYEVNIPEIGIVKVNEKN